MAILSIPKTSFDFCAQRFRVLGSMVVLAIFSLVLGKFRGLNYGIDFKGGTLAEIRLPEITNLKEIREILEKSFSGDVQLQEYGTPKNILIFLEHRGEDIKETFKKVLGDQIEIQRLETVGPKVSQTLIQNSFYAVFWTLLALLIYIWIRFEWEFGLASILALVHDCWFLMAMFVLMRWEFNETAVVALLTTASYSINDTVVVFDRIRENRLILKGRTLYEIINISINETLSRTLFTSLTTLLALFSLYIFGGPVIARFSLPILVGIAFGTYSSICIAAPLLLFFTKDRKLVEQKNS